MSVSEALGLMISFGIFIISLLTLIILIIKNIEK
ncbi:MAG: putative holin-like toxin [Streptococcaceae bacterium]|nr:putative holin-like toxin [Streptococcaceae bacterium]